MSILSKYKNSACLKWAASYLLISLPVYFQSIPALAVHNKKVDRHQQSVHGRHHHRKIAHKKISPEEAAAVAQAQARAAEESRFNQGRNSIIGRAYQLYDSGTSEALLGNYKYSILQLKLASELLNGHNEENSALGIAALTALASSAKVSGDLQLARSTYEKLLLMMPSDTQIILKLARVQAASGDWQAARTSVNRVINISPDNQEASVLLDLITSNRNPPKY